MTAFGLLIPAAAAAAIIWRIQTKRSLPEQGPLATSVFVPLVLVVCGAAFLTFILLAGQTN